MWVGKKQLSALSCGCAQAVRASNLGRRRDAGVQLVHKHVHKWGKKKKRKKKTFLRVCVGFFVSFSFLR